MKRKKIFFLTGSQHLYGNDVLKQVASNAEQIVSFLNKAGAPYTIERLDTLTTAEEILNAVVKINSDTTCTGVITWMHTFSPAKMWINGLNILTKPILHLHTQANEKIPYSTIDMDFMNLNQSAHGDREFGHILTKMGISRKVVAGFYKNSEVCESIYVWMRAVLAVDFSKKLKVARFGDNMRGVAVTDGDKVSAQMSLGFSVDGYGVGSLAERVENVGGNDVNALMQVYKELYAFHEADTEAIRVQARYEIALERFFLENGIGAFTTTFEDLYGLKQLPGLAVQRLMEKGYGFSGEGDWKTAALCAIIKYASKGLEGGTSFMEDYTYHLERDSELVLGAHMLEICPSIAGNKPEIVVRPLGIGGKEPPPRLVFHAKPANAVNATLSDLGSRFRLIINPVEIVSGMSMPKLPVAQVLWKAEPSLSVSATAWIYAGGGHHTVLTTQLAKEFFCDFAEISKIECIVIDKNTELSRFKQELAFSNLLWNSAKKW